MKKHQLNKLSNYLCKDDISVVGYILHEFKYNLFYMGMSIKDFKTDKPFPGVYLLINRRKIEYIGTAKNVMKRLYNQKILNGHIIIVIDTTGRKNRLRLETALVSLLDPGKNKVKTLYGKRKY